MDSLENMFTSMALLLEGPVRAERATKLASRDGKTNDPRSFPYKDVGCCVRSTESDWSSRVTCPVPDTARTVDGIQ